MGWSQLGGGKGLGAVGSSAMVGDVSKRWWCVVEKSWVGGKRADK